MLIRVLKSLLVVGGSGFYLIPSGEIPKLYHIYIFLFSLHTCQILRCGYFVSTLSIFKSFCQSKPRKLLHICKYSAQARGSNQPYQSVLPDIPFLAGCVNFLPKNLMFQAVQIWFRFCKLLILIFFLINY